jgi:predicted dehydrogenase
MSAIRVAVIGLGAIAFEHLTKLRSQPGVEVAGVCDLSSTLASAVSERFGVGPAYTNHEHMLATERPDVVHVLTPPQSHHPLVMTALDAGAHVFVEKPIAPTLAEYAEMRDAAARHGLLLCENYNYRFSRGVLAALSAYSRGDLGQVVNIDVSFCGVMTGAGAYADPHVPHFAHALPGGALQNFASHPISLALPFLGECEEALCVRRRLDASFAGDDELRALLRGARGGCAALTVSRHARPAHFTLSVQGTRASAEVDVYAGHMQLDAGESAIAGSLRRGFGHLAAGAALTARAATGRRDAFEGLATLLDGFYDAVRGGPPPITAAEMDAVNGVLHELLSPTEAACG